MSSNEANGAIVPIQDIHPTQVRRSARSREGCLTCRRRKVRCNEQRPRCSHCERLNLECRWRPRPSATAQKRQGATGSTATVGEATQHRNSAVLYSPRSIESSLSTSLSPQAPHAVDQCFDYASFMWGSGDVWQQRLSLDNGAQLNTNGAAFTADHHTIASSSESLPNDEGHLDIPGRLLGQQPMGISSNHGLRYHLSTGSEQPAADDHILLDYFIRTVVPPILTQIETQQKWSSMRQILISMSNASLMVRCAILAFSDLLLRRREAPWLPSTHSHYEKAVSEFSLFGDTSNIISHSPRRENLLATLFFLSYVDILEGRMEVAHANLKTAYSIFQKGEKSGFRSVEIRLLSWIRLLDARAVSAGGEGLFLSDDDETLLVQPSPSSFEGDAEGRSEELPEGDIEDVLFQVLYHPGIVFFQKVQSFMGRISKIDPWHRSRGTVEDETEVMNIAAGISKDLRMLYDTRPPLMDYAVAGKLTSAHVSPNLAFTITRAFRTYLSNYHASKIHLHRVAYKTLPLTRETTESLSMIRHLAKLMVERLEEEETLPVNMLWPLLMLGSEEHELNEREWIKEQILRMEKVATNARITAQVLEEVQARQDASKARVDIRSIMHAIFDSCFAIV